MKALIHKIRLLSQEDKSVTIWDGDVERKARAVTAFAALTPSGIPLELRTLLLEFGNVVLGPIELFGVHRNYKDRTDIRKIYNSYRALEGFPEEVIPVASEDDGTAYCVNSSGDISLYSIGGGTKDLGITYEDLIRTLLERYQQIRDRPSVSGNY